MVVQARARSDRSSCAAGARRSGGGRPPRRGGAGTPSRRAPSRARERRQVRAPPAPGRTRTRGRARRPLDHAGVAGEPAGLLGARAQVGAGDAGQPRVELVEAAPGPHRGQRGGQRALRRAWRSARCWWRRRSTSCRAASSARASLRAESSGSPWSHSSTSTRSRPNSSISRRSSLRGGRRAVVDERRGHRALAAAGEHPTSGRPSRRRGRASVNCGAPFSPAIWPRLSARARRA